MTSYSAPFGLMPYKHARGGTIRYDALKDGITSAYAADLYTGTLVQLTTNGVLNISSATTQTNYGVFAGCEYTDSAGNFIQSAYWPASTAVTGGVTAFVWRDPDIIYQVQAAGSIPVTARGEEADFSNITGGSTKSGRSTMVLATSFAGAGSSAQARIVDLAYSPRNEWSDAYTIVQVVINEVNSITPNTNAV